jgi:p38 MAP kinase
LDLLEKLLHWDPAKRPTAAEALSHPYFDDIRDADFEQVCKREGIGTEEVEN